MSSITSPTASASTLPEQSITAFAHAEIMTDADTGQSTFCIATDEHLSDFQAATPARGLAAAEKLRKKADEIEALANEYAATVVLPAFIEAYNIQLIETSLDELAKIDPDLASRVAIYSVLKSDGTFTVIVPEGQAPIVRLAVVREIILTLQNQADAA